MPLTERRRIDLLQVDVTPCSASEVVGWIEHAPKQGRKLIVGHNLHSVFLAHTESEFAELYRQADLVLVDGQPLRWAGLLSRFKERQDWGPSQRVGSVDWIRNLTPTASLQTIAVVGASSASNRLTTEILTRTGAVVRGWDGEGWSGEKEQRVTVELMEFEPDLVLVGLGMPLQEHFYLRNKNDLPSAVYALVGGAIDQMAGIQRRAPAWVGRIGLEWLWRLVLSPRRLGRRYLVEPFSLARVLVSLRKTR